MNKEERIAAKPERMRKLNVIFGSTEELAEMIATGLCNGDISELCGAFEDRVYCHQREQMIPLAMAQALTPFHTRDIGFEGHAICEIQCGRACQYVGFMDNTVGIDKVVYSFQTFKLGSDSSVLTRSELLAAGEFVSASSGLSL